MVWLIYGLSVGAFLIWLLPMLELLSRKGTGLILERVPADGSEPLPRLTIIIPALNEEETVEMAMRTILAVEYPDLEFIAVDDRSTDRTGEILDQIQKEDNRLKVIHVTELPQGWLGKNHALHLASQVATGEFILFTDADVHFDPTTLRRAVRHCIRKGLDFLTLTPECILEGFWETLVVTFFGFAFVLKFKPWKVADPKSKAYVGIGAFNMVRTEEYRNMGGHVALKMDVADDLKLGKMMKFSTGRADVGIAGKLVRVRWIVGLKGIVHGLTKNMFAGFSYNFWGAVGGILGVILLAIYPAIGLFLGPLVARLFCVGTLILMVVMVKVVTPAQPVSPLYGLCFPIAGFVVIYIILRSMFFTYKQNGIIWRGTRYSLKELRKGVV